MKRSKTIRVDRDFYNFIFDFQKKMELKKRERIPFTDATRYLTEYLKEKERRKQKKSEKGFYDLFGL